MRTNLVTRAPLFALLITLTLASTSALATDAQRVFERATQHEANSADGTSIAAYSAGDGPTVLFLHGFPDLWLTWSGTTCRTMPPTWCLGPCVPGSTRGLSTDF